MNRTSSGVPMDKESGTPEDLPSGNTALCLTKRGAPEEYFVEESLRDRVESGSVFACSAVHEAGQAAVTV